MKTASQVSSPNMSSVPLFEKQSWSLGQSLLLLMALLGRVTSFLWMGLSLFALASLCVGAVSWLSLGFSAEAPHLFLSQNVFVLSSVGILFAVISALTALPVALATAVVLAHHQSSGLAQLVLQFFRGLSFLPSIVYGFVFCWAVGPFLQNEFQSFWLALFRPEGGVAQLLAFAFTLLTYPFVLIADGTVTIDVFHQSSLRTIVDFSQGSYSAVVIIFSLSFFLIPIFVSLFFRQFTGTNKSQVQEAALAVGATRWEALQISVSQSMTSELRCVFFFGVGKAFVEGVSIFIILNYFFLSGNWQNFFWAETFSAFLLKTLLFHSLTWVDYLSLGGLLLILHIVLRIMQKGLRLTYNEELMR